MFDFHTHQQQPISGIRNFHQQQKQDFEAYNLPCSVGLHPWFVDTQTWQTDMAWLNWAAQQTKVLAIGECGLDALRGADLATQQSAFIAQLHLAQKMGKPLIVHCVRRFNELLAVAKKHNNKQAIPIIVHGFNNKTTILTRLLDAGFYVSFGAALLQTNSAAAKALLLTPPNRFLLETDDSTANIEQIYEQTAILLQLNVADVAQQIAQNWKNICLAANNGLPNANT